MRLQSYTIQELVEILTNFQEPGHKWAYPAFAHVYSPKAGTIIRIERFRFTPYNIKIQGNKHSDRTHYRFKIPLTTATVLADID